MGIVTKCVLRAALLALTLVVETAHARADGATQAVPASPPAQKTVPDQHQLPEASIQGGLGLDLTSADGNNRMHLWFRTQLRFSTPFNSDPRSAEDFADPTVHSFDLQRIRIKLQGDAYRPWLHYYFEYDFKSRLLDVQLTLSRLRWLQLRVGQWKVTYNRERVDSSGKQQSVERSIVNREFTLDRQPVYTARRAA